jgi:hypothetical protein
MKASTMLAYVAALTITIGTGTIAGAQQSNYAEIPLSADLGVGYAQPRLEMKAADLPQITAAEAAMHPPIPAPRTGVSDEESARRKVEAQTSRTGAPEASFAAPSGATAAGAVSIPQTPGAVKGFTGIPESCSFLIPSDHGLAVGLTYVVQVVNICISIFDKNGVQQAGFPKGLNSFFGLPAGASTFDPRALYDWVNNRYIVIMLEDRPSGSNPAGILHLAASKTNDPRGGWWFYSFGVGAKGDGPDYPTLGQDRQAIYVGLTDFLAAGNLSDYVFYFPKAQVYAGAGFSFNFNFNLTARGQRVDSVQPANVMNKDDNPRAEFMVNSFYINFGGGQCHTSACNGLVIWAVSNPLAATGSPGPELTGFIVPTAHNYSLPANARQPGCTSGTCLIDTGEVRVSGEVTYASGSLFGALSTNSTNPHAINVSNVLWFQLRPFLNDNDARCTGAFINKCPQITGASLLNDDCYFCGANYNTNGSTFYGTPQPDPEGNVTMVFALSDDGHFPGVAYVSRRVTQTQNTMHDGGIYLAAGQHFYKQLDTHNRNRWGDYTAVAPDLTSSLTTFMWFAGQFSDSVGNWATTIGENGFTAVTQP